nr:hypothetical protein StreXyl84_63210 [Streptomyces sp. Xyl84]
MNPTHRDTALDGVAGASALGSGSRLPTASDVLDTGWFAAVVVETGSGLRSPPARTAVDAPDGIGPPRA